MYRVHVAPSLDGVAAEEWDHLISAHGAVYSSWRWLKMSETPPDGQPTEVCYLLCRDSSQRLVGGLPIYLHRGQPNSLYDPVRLFPDVFASPAAGDHADLAWQPGISGAAQSGYRGDLPVDPCARPTERGEVMAALLEAYAELADVAGARASWFPYLSPGDAAEVRNALSAGGAMLFTDVEMVIDVAFDDFDAYAESLPSHQRHNVRRERRLFEAGGASVTRTTLADAQDVVAPLYANLLSKHGGQDTRARAARYMARLVEYFGHDGLVWLCERADRVVGFSLYLPFEQTLFGRFTGFDYEHAKSLDYFNLTIYEPVCYAVAHGFSRLHLGIKSYEAKLLRGAVASPLWTVVQRSPALAQACYDAADKHNKAKIAEFASSHGSAIRREVDFDGWLRTGRQHMG